MELEKSVVLEDSVIRCSKCLQVFLSKPALQQHELTHHADCSYTDMAMHMNKFKAAVVLERVQIYECPDCTRGFFSERKYHVHVLKHEQKKVTWSKREELDAEPEDDRYRKIFSCEECEARFVLFSTLVAHGAVHRPMPHACSCGVAFYLQRDLTEHNKLVHNIYPPSDPDRWGRVRKRYPKKPKIEKLEVEVKEEEEEEDEEEWQEPKPKRRKKNNWKNKKAKTKRKPEPCTECQEIFSSRTSLALHMKTIHNMTIAKTNTKRNFLCEICDKTLSNKQSLLLHLKTHTGEKSFKCDECGKFFSQSGALTLHKKRHLNLREFICSYCDKAFYTKGSKLLHERSHTKEKPFVCTICDKRFADPSAHARHLRVHTGDRRYKCKYCPKAFTDAGQQNYHMRRHRNYRPHECEICEKKFYSLSDLKLHVTNVHTRLKRFVCDDCNDGFTTKANLAIHIDRVHRQLRLEHCKRCKRDYLDLRQHMRNFHKKIILPRIVKSEIEI